MTSTVEVSIQAVSPLFTVAAVAAAGGAWSAASCAQAGSAANSVRPRPAVPVAILVMCFIEISPLLRAPIRRFRRCGCARLGRHRA